MGIYEDSKKIFLDVFGQEVAKQLDGFDKPDKYPEDFLEECTYFLSKLVGENAAKEKFQPLYKKYCEQKKYNKGGTKR